LRTLYSFLIIFLTWVPMISASPSPDGWTIEQCLAYARQSSPRVLAARHQLDASRARIRQAAALPHPTLDLDYDLQPGFFDIGGSGESYVGFSQELEFPAKTLVKRRVAEKESLEIASDLEALLLDLDFQVKEGFYLLLLAEERARLQEQNLDLANEFLDKTKLKYEAGDIARVEVMRAQVEAAKAMVEAKRAMDEEVVARATLNYVLGRRDQEALTVVGEFRRTPLDSPLDRLLEVAREARPEMARLRVGLEKEESNRTLAKLEYAPDIAFGIAKHRIESEPSSWDTTFSFTLPLYFWQPSAKLAEADAGIRSLQMERQSMEDQIRLEVTEAFQQAASAFKQIELFETDILKQAQDIHMLFLESYQAGQIGGIDLIEARRSLNEAHLTYNEALCQYSISHAALERATGQTH